MNFLYWQNILEKTENNFLSVLKMAEYHIFMQAGNLCIDSDFIYMHFNLYINKIINIYLLVGCCICLKCPYLCTVFKKDCFS